MLQIATGKFFKHGVGQENHLRGVLYTNYRAQFDETGLETAAGRLTPSSNLSGLRSLIYEVTERYESSPTQGALVSLGAEPFLKDMAVIVSFCLDLTCTPDPDLARRLLGDAPLAPNAHGRPKQYVSRPFETEIAARPGEAEQLQAFIGDLIALDRKHYQGALRAIRTYVGGLQRLGDDVDLAYTLLVASVESLTQGFDGHHASWGDFSADKRERIDQALEDAPAAVADKVRSALLEIEHVALARRFKAYALQTLKPAYFREDAHQRIRPIGRADLAGALELAYVVRSKYVHELKAIPKPIIYVHDHGEWTRVGKTIALTVQGLARLARTLILQFVQDAPKLATEDYAYSLDLPGVVEIELAPQYWVWRHESFETSHARMKLGGVLDLHASLLLKEDGAALVDIFELLRKYQTLIPDAPPAHRLPMLALYYLFNASLADSQRLEGWLAFVKGYEDILDAPSLESLSIHVALKNIFTWSASVLAKIREQYFRTRYRDNGLQLPWLFEAALDLVLAEAYRCEGDEDRARAMIAQARENHPTMQRLVAFETELTTPLQPIDWRLVLLPQDPPATEPAETPPSAAVRRPSHRWHRGR
ncbi:MAG: hypothetical protein JF615_01980 [Asticcacaulis sp.]|nr:hypothetical protein [Asticcacaulis sp.]